MALQTTNFGLIKPELTDPADITAFNANWDKIDDQLKKAGESGGSDIIGTEPGTEVEGDDPVVDPMVQDYVNSEIDNLQQTLDGEIEDLKQSFTDGCNTIVEGITNIGITPESNSPEDIVEAINEVYEAGKMGSTFTNVGFMIWGNGSVKTPTQTNTTYLTQNSNVKFTVKVDFDALIIGTFTGGESTSAKIALKINTVSEMTVNAPNSSSKVNSKTLLVKLKAGDVITGSITTDGNWAYNSTAWFGVYRIS